MPHIINGVQCRTKIESLQHIIDQAKKGKIGPNAEKGDYRGSCQYTYRSGNHCAVGSLFSEAQLKVIDQEDENESNISILADVFGKKNIEAVTGMTISELRTLQATHDEAFGNYGYTRSEVLEAVIKKAESMLEKALKQATAEV
jgi:hypothetical protein